MAAWQDEVFAALRAAGVRQVGYVPGCRPRPPDRAVPMPTPTCAPWC